MGIVFHKSLPQEVLEVLAFVISNSVVHIQHTNIRFQFHECRLTCCTQKILFTAINSTYLVSTSILWLLLYEDIIMI